MYKNIFKSIVLLSSFQAVAQQTPNDVSENYFTENDTVKKLKEVAAAMDMQLVYALVPVDDSLDAMIERKAEALAKEIVMRTSQTMVLEDQEVKYERLNEAIKERKEKILQEMPKALWD